MICVILFSTACGKIPGPDSTLGNSMGGAPSGGGSGTPGNWIDTVASARQARSKGDAAGTEKLFLEAIEQCKKKNGDESIEVAMCYEELADFYRETQDWLKALKAYKEDIKIIQKVDPQRDMTVLRKNFKIVKKKCKEYGLEEKDPANAAKTEDKEADSSSDSK